MCGTIIFDLVTLTLKFDLLLKNFNLGQAFQTRRDGTFILHMCIPRDKTFHMVPYFLASRDECPGSLCHSPSVGVGVHVCLGCVDKNFNLGHNFQTKRCKILILHMCIPCDKTFHMVPLFLTLKFNLLLKNFNLGHNFQTSRVRTFILYMCISCDKTFHMVP